MCPEKSNSPLTSYPNSTQLNLLAASSRASKSVHIGFQRLFIMFPSADLDLQVGKSKWLSLIGATCMFSTDI